MGVNVTKNDTLKFTVTFLVNLTKNFMNYAPLPLSTKYDEK